VNFFTATVSKSKTAMKKHAENTAPHQTLRAFAESDDDVAFRLFAQLCRSSPALREWLWEEFARKPETRAKIAATLAQPNPDHDAEAFAENRPLQIEAARLRENLSGRIYGGLTWGEVETLIRHNQAGKLDLGTFLLVSEWRQADNAAPVPPRVAAATVDWFREIVGGGETRLLRHAEKTVRLLDSLEKAPKRRGLFGHTDWWKLNVLFYMLRRPRESYRTREFRTYLADLGIEVGAKDIRRFCSRHGIRRDVRAGRPKQI
jgi:hypothetical protein